MVIGAGALHLIDKKTGRVTQIRYEDGLPSNTISRLRLDANGLLWMITSNGLCMFNPKNKRFTPYTLRDGVALAEQTIATDFVTSNNNILFGGNNSVIMFNPNNISHVSKPANVEITDVRVLNQTLPVNSFFRYRKLPLNPTKTILASRSHRWVTANAKNWFTITSSRVLTNILQKQTGCTRQTMPLYRLVILFFRCMAKTWQAYGLPT